MDSLEIKEYLDEAVERFNHESFVQLDPVQIPHQFTLKEDIEISGFLISIIAWGNRKSIITNGYRLIDIMKGEPFQFVMNYEGFEKPFVHRTFNKIDLDFFFRSLQYIYQNKGGLEKVFKSDLSAFDSICHFRNEFLRTEHLKRSEKHIANPAKGSSAKRINMFLRWMIRQDKKGVDFGIWKEHTMSELYVPLDVHTANSARALGLLNRKANDWKALEELMGHLRAFCPEDPCKYDFALFGLSETKELEH